MFKHFCAQKGILHKFSRSGIFKPNPKFQSNFSSHYPIPQALMAAVESEIEPTCYTQASKSSYWQHAILDEFNALLHQGTWSLVPSSSHQNTIGCKWVFKIKRRYDGSIEPYKACLVAKGFISSPRSIILTLSVQWSIRSLFAPF